jgi:hypothetical protein
MNITVKYTATEAYFREFYTQWLERSKWKKWEPLLSALLMVLGVVYYFLNKTPHLWFVPLFVSLVGAFELLKYYYQKRQWLAARKASKLFNQEMELIFTEDQITHQGPFSEGSFRWKGLDAVRLTSGGLFLIPENGVSIYLPAVAFPSLETMKLIQEKHASIKTN